MQPGSEVALLPLSHAVFLSLKLCLLPSLTGDSAFLSSQTQTACVVQGRCHCEETDAPGREKQEVGINGPKRDVELRVGPRLLPREALGLLQSCRDLHPSAYICICLFPLLVPVYSSFQLPIPFLYTWPALPHQELPHPAQEANPLQKSSCGPDADTLCIQSISFCPELRPLLNHLSVEAKGRQPLQPFPSVFLFQVPTLSKEEKQIRIKGWRKAFEVFDSYTVIIQNRNRTGRYYQRNTGQDQSFIQPAGLAL